VIVSFADATAADIFAGSSTRAARRLPTALHNVARRKLFMVNAAVSINDLRVPPSNHLEKLLGDLAGWYSIRINDQYRIVFKFQGSQALNVKIDDYH
jgi:proteic killer suppression protein